MSKDLDNSGKENLRFNRKKPLEENRLREVHLSAVTSWEQSSKALYQYRSI